MPERILLDNDVVLKMASYRLDAELISATTEDEVPPSILTVTKHVLRSQIERAKRVKDKAAAKAALEAIFENLQFIEPTEEEISLAADFEEAAGELSLELDGGESLLFALLLRRAARLLLTGDKRAIKALERISPAEGHGRVACFEQLIAHVMQDDGYPTVRTKICAESETDKAIALCFSCGRASVEAASVAEGLDSYIKSIRETAPKALLSGGILFPKVS
jgi:hypothetical protein